MPTPSFFHAPAGAVVAKETFGVRDEEILAAIRCHTLGGSAMTGLMLAVFVADFIEPGREDFPGLAEAARWREPICAPRRPSVRN